MVFLHIQQVFDKVWHEGLLYKLKRVLPHTYYSILRSYLTNRQFMVKYTDAITTTFPIEAGITQGNVLGPLLFSIYTADLPISTGITIATFADDTALLASHANPTTASSSLQRGLGSMEKWFHKWSFKIKITLFKITLYKAVIKPVWTYGIQLWGTASNSNIEILQRFQSKTLRSLLNAPWYVTNETIHRDLKIPTVKDEIHKSRSRYNTRVNNHHNPLVTQLLDTTDQIRRLKRKYPLD